MATATITWVDPTVRTDGSAIAPDTFKINIFDSLAATPNVPIGTVASGVQTFTTGLLSVGVHAFTLDAVDSEGDTSAMTAAVDGTVALAAPMPPTGVTVVVTP